MAFSLAKLARFGPCAPVADFLMPAPALAVDHKLPKASPPPVAEAGLAPGLAELKEVLEVRAGLDVPAGRAGMEVK